MMMTMMANAEQEEEVREANERCMGDIRLKKRALVDNDDQWGVFASRPYARGSVVISSSPLRLHHCGLLPESSSSSSSSKPTSKPPPPPTNTNTTNPSPTPCSHSIQTGWEEHVLMDLPARYLNHSCDPNVCVKGGGGGGGRDADDDDNDCGLNPNGSYDFIAFRDIDAGEEIRFDYETTEYEVGAFSECRCGSASCRGVVRGYHHGGSEAVLARYGEENVAGYLVRGR